MATFKVNPGKIVRISIVDIAKEDNNFNILDSPGIAPDIKMILNEPLTLNISSNFTSLFGNANTTGLNLLGGISKALTGKGFSGQKKEFGFQSWNNSEPISFTINLQFYMGMAGEYDGEREVYNPITTLAKLPLPSEPAKSKSKAKNLLSTLSSPGPSLLSVLAKNGGEDGTAINAGRITSISIGKNIRFPNVIVRRAEPTFSEDVDSNGFPIEGRISIEVVTIYNATQQMLDVI